MSKRDLAVVAGAALLAWHVLSIIADARRCQRNLARFNAAPTLPNFVKLAVAEGALIGDLGWL
jgi:hypothetical protein